MYLGIVIPLKASSVSKNWAITVQTLKDTLNSIVNQTNQNFSAVVICHDIPSELEQKFSSIDFIKVTFLPPNKLSDDFNHQDLVIDKNLKIATGMKFLANKKIDYWYALDSDDLISHDFVAYCQHFKNWAGIILKGGYIIYKRQNEARLIDNIDQFCGSTSLLSNQLITLPKVIDRQSITSIPWCRYAHMNMEQYFNNEINQPFKVIEKPLIGYVLGSGDNLSDKWRQNIWKLFKYELIRAIKAKRINNQIRALFSLSIKEL